MDNAVGSTAHTTPFDWRELYLQALFETERAQMQARIAEAERALLRRERELFVEFNARAEREALTNALNALFALRTSFRSGENGGRRIGALPPSTRRPPPGRVPVGTELLAWRLLTLLFSRPR